MFKSHLFLSPTIVSCDEELNYFILQNEGKLFECSYPKPIHGILGKSSMLVAVGDTHKRLRNVAVSLVTITKSKPEFLNDIENTAIRVLHSWKDKPQVIFCKEARKVQSIPYETVVYRKVINISISDHIYRLAVAVIIIVRNWLCKRLYVRITIMLVEFTCMQFTFNVIVKQVLGLSPDEPQTTQILEDFLTFMKGLISLPLYIPGTPYARAVKVLKINT